MSAQPIPLDPFVALEEAWRDELRATRFSSSGPRDYCYASRVQSCERRQALDLTHPDDEPPFSDEALARMERGKEREEAIFDRLRRVGRRSAVPFEVIEGQKVIEIRDRDGVLLYRGKMDGVLRIPGYPRVPVECKSGDSFRRIRCFEDFEASPWTRHAPDQLLMYLLAEALPLGLFVIDDVLPRFIPVHLEPNLARAERCLQVARQAVDFRFGRGPLPAATEDRAECRRCPHAGRSCTASLDAGSGVTILADEALIRLAEEREKHAPAAAEYRRADEALKAALRGVEHGLLGPFEVHGKWQARTVYDIPDEVKAPYRKTDPKGTFKVEIERVLP